MFGRREGGTRRGWREPTPSGIIGLWWRVWHRFPLSRLTVSTGPTPLASVVRRRTVGAAGAVRTHAGWLLIPPGPNSRPVYQLQHRRLIPVNGHGHHPRGRWHIQALERYTVSPKPRKP